MEHIKSMLEEKDPKKILFYLEYMEMVIDMMEKRKREHELGTEYKQLLEHYNEVVSKK